MSSKSWIRPSRTLKFKSARLPSCSLCDATLPWVKITVFISLACTWSSVTSPLVASTSAWNSLLKIEFVRCVGGREVRASRFAP